MRKLRQAVKGQSAELVDLANPSCLSTLLPDMMAVLEAAAVDVHTDVSSVWYTVLLV